MNVQKKLPDNDFILIAFLKQLLPMMLTGNFPLLNIPFLLWKTFSQPVNLVMLSKQDVLELSAKVLIINIYEKKKIFF